MNSLISWKGFEFFQIFLTIWQISFLKKRGCNLKLNSIIRKVLERDVESCYKIKRKKNKKEFTRIKKKINKFI